MDEQHDDVSTHLETQEAEVQQTQEIGPTTSPRLHTKRTLLSFVDDQEKRKILLGRQPLPGEDLTQLEQIISQYNVARTSRPNYIPTNPIVSEDDPILDRIRTRSDIVNVFTSIGLSWRVVLIDLKQVLSFQQTIRVDNLDDRTTTANKDIDLLLGLCYPPNFQMEFSFETNERGHTLSTSNPNLMYIPAQFSVQIGNQTISAPGFAPQINFGFMNAVHYQGRFFMRDGYHRAAGLLRNNNEEQVIIPCIVVEAQTLNQTGWQPGMISEAVLLSNHPPYIRDFWDNEVSYELLQKAKRRLFRMPLDLFEIDEY